VRGIMWGMAAGIVAQSYFQRSDHVEKQHSVQGKLSWDTRGTYLDSFQPRMVKKANNMTGRKLPAVFHWPCGLGNWYVMQYMQVPLVLAQRELSGIILFVLQFDTIPPPVRPLEDPYLQIGALTIFLSLA